MKKYYSLLCFLFCFCLNSQGARDTLQWQSYFRAEAGFCLLSAGDASEFLRDTMSAGYRRSYCGRLACGFRLKHSFSWGLGLLLDHFAAYERSTAHYGGDPHLPQGQSWLDIREYYYKYLVLGVFFHGQWEYAFGRFRAGLGAEAGWSRSITRSYWRHDETRYFSYGQPGPVYSSTSSESPEASGAYSKLHFGLYFPLSCSLSERSDLLLIPGATLPVSRAYTRYGSPQPVATPQTSLRLGFRYYFGKS